MLGRKARHIQELEQSDPAGLAMCMKNLGHVLCDQGRITEG